MDSKLSGWHENKNSSDEFNPILHNTEDSLFQEIPEVLRDCSCSGCFIFKVSFWDYFTVVICCLFKYDEDANMVKMQCLKRISVLLEQIQMPVLSQQVFTIMKLKKDC